MTTWLLFTYKVPNKPSAQRVYVWRKLKRLGAILLNEAIWILPDTPRTAEQFQWLAVEIQEMKGVAFLWKSNLIIETPEDFIIAQFNKQIENAYKKLLTKITKKQSDLAALSREYQQLASRDYFNAELGKQVREKLLSLRGGDK
jgi:DNA-binding transcriptional regulator PaaX